jgi:hypothetical protein
LKVETLGSVEMRARFGYDRPMVRPLPTAQETARILAAKRTRPPRRTPPPAGRPLGKLIKALDERFGKGEGGLQARWPEIVGEALARTTEPVKLSRPRGGAGAVLELKVGGAAAALIQHQAPDILARVNLFLGEGSVAKLRIVQGVVKPRASSTSPAQRANARKRAQPLDAAAEAELEAGLAPVGDDKLKAALRKLGREVLRRGD